MTTDTDHATRAIAARKAEFSAVGFPALPPIERAVTRLRDRADRELAMDLARTLRSIADYAASGALPRWLLVVVSPPIGMIAHTVRDFLCRQQGPKPALHNCLAEPRCVGDRPQRAEEPQAS